MKTRECHKMYLSEEETWNVFELSPCLRKANVSPFFLLPTLPLPIHLEIVRGELAQLVRASA